jgi:hypothetical protein
VEHWETVSESITISLVDWTSHFVKVPVIVVLTKYDMFIDRIERNLDETSLSELSDEAVKELAKNKAEAELQDICIGPLKKFSGLNIPHAEISSMYQYSDRFMRASEASYHSRRRLSADAHPPDPNN